MTPIRRPPFSNDPEHHMHAPTHHKTDVLPPATLVLDEVLDAASSSAMRSFQRRARRAPHCAAAIDLRRCYSPDRFRGRRATIGDIRFDLFIFATITVHGSGRQLP